MSELQAALEEYLSVRRALGVKLRLSGRLLKRFVDFAECEGAAVITTDLALRWATQPADVQPAQWANRLGMVRRFAQYRSATDPRTEVPPPDLLPFRIQRPVPYLYSDEEVSRLLEAARQLPAVTGLRPHTYATLFGLYAVTGMRTNEPLHLDREDVDLSQGVLTVRDTKFGKSRYVPIHPSTQQTLQEYAVRRDALCQHPLAPSFFLAEGGSCLTEWSVRWTFVKLSRQIGLRGPHDSHGPRLHDFRHHADNRIMPSHRQLLFLSLLLSPSYGGSRVFRRGIIRSSLRTDNRVRKEKIHAERVLQTERFPRVLTKQPAAGTPRFVCDLTGRGCLRGVDGAIEASLGR